MRILSDRQYTSLLSKEHKMDPDMDYIHKIWVACWSNWLYFFGMKLLRNLDIGCWIHHYMLNNCHHKYNNYNL